jgi:carboxylesterase
MNKAPLGCLILHGLSSNINCVDAIVPRLEKHKIPYRMPYLRGHGTKPADLIGVKWQDWYADGEKALKEVLNEADKVLIIALSMGSLVGLDLTLAYQDRVAGLVTIAPCLKLKDPRAALIPLLAKVQKRVVFQLNEKDYMDPETLRTNQNYPWIPSESVAQMWRYQRRINKAPLMAQIKIPLLVVGAIKDNTVSTKMIQWLYDNAGSSEKTIKWFEQSGHEMLRDGEHKQVLDVIEAFVQKQNDKAHHDLKLKQQA